MRSLNDPKPVNVNGWLNAATDIRPLAFTLAFSVPGSTQRKASVDYSKSDKHRVRKSAPASDNCV